MCQKGSLGDEYYNNVENYTTIIVAPKSVTGTLLNIKTTRLLPRECAV